MLCGDQSNGDVQWIQLGIRIFGISNYDVNFLGLEWEEAFEILNKVGQLMGDADGLIGRCDFISGLFQVC